MEKEAKTEYILYCLDLISEQIYEDKLKYLSDSDWNEIIQITMNHGITGLMYYATKTGHKQIPDQVMHKLKSIFLNITAKNMRIYSSLSKILEAFDNDNIHCIVMKGAALADQIYKDIGLRPMFDIDLLIDPDDIWKVNSVLSDLGYRSDINNFISNDHLKCANNIHYANNFTTIDVHPTLYNLPDTNPW